MRSICLGLIMTLVGLSAGCSGGGDPNALPVNGVVTMDGTPLDGAAVTFYAEAGGIGGTARTGSDGKFVVMGGDGKSKGLAPGKYKVTVSKMKGVEMNEESVGAITDADIKNDLPPTYSNPQQTKLSYSVTGDGQPIEIKLESKPKK